MRQSLFQMLGDLAGARVLDGFAGSGAIAFEALSRGAGHATLLEKSSAVFRVLAENCEALQLGSRARLLREDAYGHRTTGDPYQLIVLDPPFPHFVDDRHDPWQLASRLFDQALAPHGVLCIEHPTKLPAPAAPAGHSQQQSRTYGDTTLTLWSRGEVDQKPGG